MIGSSIHSRWYFNGVDMFKSIFGEVTFSVGVGHLGEKLGENQNAQWAFGRATTILGDFQKCPK